MYNKLVVHELRRKLEVAERDLALSREQAGALDRELCSLLDLNEMLKDTCAD